MSTADENNCHLEHIPYSLFISCHFKRPCPQVFRRKYVSNQLPTCKLLVNDHN